MARLAYGVPLVGNDFAVMPVARPLVRRIPVIKPADLPEPDIDEQLLRSIDIENVVETYDSFPARAKSRALNLVKYFFVGLLLLALAGSSWGLLRPGESNLAASHARAADSAVKSAPLSMAAAVDRQNITFLINGKTVTPSPTDIDNWLSHDLTAPADQQLVVNQDAVRGYLQSLGGQYEKKVQNKILAADGGVLSAGQDGKKLDTDVAFTQISNNLLAGKGMNFNLPVVGVTAKTLSISNIDKLLVANISTKRMAAYEHGKDVKDFLISAGVPSSPTPTGQFSITRKFVKDDMSGTNPGGGHYFVANVKYVSYFEDSLGAAIHANDWAPQTIFGRVNESLGCLGMTVADAHWVYDWAPVGTILINQK